MSLISIVVPCYNEEAAIPIFYKEIKKEIKNFNQKYKFEIIFVNDGSKDSTFAKIKELANIDENVKYIDFSRNFGKESAMYAGLKESSGDYVVVMDVDLQDPPSLIKEMIQILENDSDVDCVATRRTTRTGEPPIRSFFAKMFYKIINKMTETEIVDGARDFRMMRRKMVDAVLSIAEYNRFSKGIFSWVGYNTKWLEYENIERSAGTTKWNFWKLFKYSIEGFLSFTTAPLLISFAFSVFSFVGFAVSGIATIACCVNDFNWMLPFIITIVTFLFGCLLASVGVLSLYLSKAYTEIKNRPVYIVKNTNIGECLK